MKVGHVTERTAENQGASILDSDEMDRAGIDLGATGRLQLMAKLAEGEPYFVLREGQLGLESYYLILFLREGTRYSDSNPCHGSSDARNTNASSAYVGFGWN